METQQAVKDIALRVGKSMPGFLYEKFKDKDINEIKGVLRSWATPKKVAGSFLIADGTISILTHLKEKPLSHIARLTRAGIGIWLCLKKEG